jgi:hypothetical protein
MNGVKEMFDRQWTDYDTLVHPRIGVVRRRDSAYEVQRNLFYSTQRRFEVLKNRYCFSIATDSLLILWQ